MEQTKKMLAEYPGHNLYPKKESTNSDGTTKHLTMYSFISVAYCMG